MTEKILFLAHVDESGAALPKVAFEVLGTALALSQQLDSPLEIGLVGGNVQAAADSLAAVGAARILGVQGDDFANPRFSSDAAAAEALCRATSPQLVIAPGTSRFFRALPSLAQRLSAQVDTHITALNLVDWCGDSNPLVLPSAHRRRLPAQSAPVDSLARFRLPRSLAWNSDLGKV